MLIVLEGIDGAGTTTQAARLAEALRADGRDVHLTREPSDGPVGTLLREFLSGNHAPVDQTTLALLFAADRADHLHREVEPAIARGAVVISDRWYHSSLAYQGTDEKRAWISVLNERARRPELTVFLDVDPEVAARRRSAARRREEIFDRIETQRAIADGYRSVIETLSETERIATLDGERDPDAVTADLVALARQTCAEAGAAPR
jgi:dTMP kinase